MKKLQINLELSIRQCELEDANFIHDLMRNNMMRYFESIPERWCEKKYWKCYAPERIIIVEYEKKPVGFFDYEMDNNELYIHNIQIIPKYQLRGIGRSIVNYLKEIAKNENIKHIKGKVFKENIDSYNLMQKSGFIIKEDLVNEKSYLIAFEV
ncbi:TPA: GNAT family N-acetyltransferase [Candidatus Woesearchaeota archaeon]|nr:GNAT family N-acetyltransferase [Candidatus Woesearchaeota archaeon]HIH31683.1 GNAT family N-acetyltransferase [Candidatus Woesearchaeota archaeon]HIH54946.1 GNAT family N-acetyltransferase [Candidatus Woesearchaeota archaeon]HIJ02639.1 GNAT family N-acetyltransferase [Candidatus Woesearchaeota archaeon]HIJ13623.1 GNAT family N-acetyltransferase [Candidatus Woesearchaeota archaeon]